jgi:hypothetical protein
MPNCKIVLFLLSNFCRSFIVKTYVELYCQTFLATMASWGRCCYACHDKNLNEWSSQDVMSNCKIVLFLLSNFCRSFIVETSVQVYVQLFFQLWHLGEGVAMLSLELEIGISTTIEGWLGRRCLGFGIGRDVE